MNIYCWQEAGGKQVSAYFTFLDIVRFFHVVLLNVAIASTWGRVRQMWKILESVGNYWG
ncbi:hypothetical protein [Anabaena azotica]|uniref:Uncharacterized protein n=1 Tax=Anabaena azotica FACHB-119 TaxID=947527 RepID=A0ABR8CZE5_9NOST|nr:hypothetical protein [Anabaena azotica]MBD2499526.1 hypothetical protein [Anabaena azotica FACHB-119]